MASQITVRIPDDLADWLSESPSKTDTVIEALRSARRAEIHRRIRSEFELKPADTPDDWGDPTEFSDTNQTINWTDNAR